MPSITKVNPSEVELLPEKKNLLREPYLEALRELRETKEPIQFSPNFDAKETLRSLRVNITRAANDLDMGDIVTSRETKEGNLVVYLKPISVKRNRKNKEDNNGEVSPQDDDSPE